eukprot:3315273-Amphidinium_carterae.1
MGLHDTAGWGGVVGYRQFSPGGVPLNGGTAVCTSSGKFRRLTSSIIWGSPSSKGASDWSVS